ncbi:TetR/AcrR family transcriptional regulator [Mycobacterium bourgelatii]|uniref:Transcriptional regulator n=1 Tax=Mycobacterium bourgelatii TaxID=1273442 RepID=A0A7I9YPP1_MYCBU|nr:TetR/AcrR family transcriptional regulator [Mycobacterium bourgelatii]MCV6973743.1 TetR/AcrR family transcriptional regulator [Mycobacterium bourgelatii]GFG90645.1 transcriptional regulator [Mycobacterium bourgelatii]
MTGADWLVGDARRSVATERIYDAAADFLARDGLHALDIDKLARQVHCSRATIYRYVGGKSEIRNAVIQRAAARVTQSVRSAVKDLSGRERLVTAIIMSVQQIRADPLGQLVISSIRGGTTEVAWLSESDLLADFASDLAGLADGDPQAASWIVRVVLSLMYWPEADEKIERQLIEQFVAPAFAETGGHEADAASPSDQCDSARPALAI